MANLNGKLQKFSFFYYEASADVNSHGIAIHPNGKIFTNVGAQNIQVFNDDLTPSYSLNLQT